MYKRIQTKQREYLVERRHPRIRVLVMNNVHEDKAEREGVYDVVGVDKGWGDRQMTKGEDREDREIERKR